MQDFYESLINDNKRVCRAFAYAASQTWFDLQDCSELNEESITDYRLLLLKRICPQEVQYVKFSKNREGENGADWEWWFGSGGEWFGMLVQAKRLKIPKLELEYTELGHTVGTSKELQVDKLLKYANTRKLYPMYCFYNYWSAQPPSIKWKCGTYSERQELWGASIADAKKIKYKIDHKKKSLAEIAPISMPLMCLACCKGWLGEKRSTLPHRARSVALSLARNGDNSDVLVPELTNQLPPYVTLDDSQSTLDVPEDLGGILIVQEDPDLYINQT